MDAASVRRLHDLLREAARLLSSMEAEAALAQAAVLLDRPAAALPHLQAAFEAMGGAPPVDLSGAIKAAMARAGEAAHARAIQVVDGFDYQRALVQLKVRTTPIVHFSIVRSLCGRILAEIPATIRDAAAPLFASISVPMASADRQRVREETGRAFHAAVRAFFDPMLEAALEPPPPYDDQEPEWTEAQERGLRAWCRGEMPSRVDAIWSRASEPVGRMVYLLVADHWSDAVVDALDEAAAVLANLGSSAA